MRNKEEIEEYEEISFDTACQLLKEKQPVECLVPNGSYLAMRHYTIRKWEKVLDAYHLLEMVSKCDMPYLRFRRVKPKQPMQKSIYVAMDKHGNWFFSSEKVNFVVGIISCQKFTLTEGIFDE